MPITAETLSALSGLTFTADQANAAVSVVTSRAKSYTRGIGFTDDGIADDIESVIQTAVLRLLVNPTNVERDAMGSLSVQYGNNFQGWTLSETQVLNRYRERAR
ncbi:hypothetical protein [Mycolicibacterium neworleansense]|uniref:Uncharacterized protein n=1 Tax=Mycolicibacterium neworleansense TaxID=146018 RepID=A0A0H5RWT5_9MYCO|nr:hypothetical protein [Mycolicibacterium neworleansense]MCV7365473.1 hypothetical protein [Mycolicibacterium neworleansense]CRZ17987.1 hypothetical protein BN2156_04884 [Mycolicibacterium neworleansense]